jgi:solute carrier family 45 protein 1/2/4
LNSLKLGKWLGDRPAIKTPINAIILTGAGVTILDFCADSSDSPLRAFLLDVCNVDDQDTGLNVHAMLGGLGSAFGFVLAAIDWKNTFLKYIGRSFIW